MTSPRDTTGHGQDMGAQCEFCAGKTFRRSHLHIKDLLPLLLFRYPVRCVLCSKRQGVSFFVAARAISSKAKQVRAPRDEASWSGWNSSQRGSDKTVPGDLGGRTFSALPVHTPVAMPNLKGVTLQHVDDVATNHEASV